MKKWLLTLVGILAVCSLLSLDAMISDAFARGGGRVVEEDIKAEAAEVVAWSRFVHILGETEAPLRAIGEAVRV